MTRATRECMSRHRISKQDQNTTWKQDFIVLRARGAPVHGHDDWTGSGQYTGRYGESHCAMIVNRSVKIRTPMITSSAPETSSMA